MLKNPVCVAVALFSVFAANACASDIPAVVVRLADAYAASRSEAEQFRPGRTLTQEYADWFFSGFTHPGGAVYTSSAIVKQAYGQGQLYWREHASERDEIFAGYGYRRIEANGTWSLAFEKSSFVPLTSGGEKWWLGSFGGVKWSELRPGQTEPDFNEAEVYIVGYVSPKGQYGHLGMYDREVLVTAFTPSLASFMTRNARRF